MFKLGLPVIHNDLIYNELVFYLFYLRSWEQTSDMKSYHGDLINQINQIDMSTITADNHEVNIYLVCVNI